MSSPVLEVEAGAASPEPESAKSWKPSSIAADVATLGTGTLLGGLINVALVFVVAKLISVEDYGYWRIFGLYAGYAGFLHFGFADGCLLRWAGRPMKEFHHEIGPALTYLFLQHVIVLAPVCVIVFLFFPGPLKFVGVAVAVYALVINLLTLLQFGLQSAKIFWPVAISTIAAPALFLGFVVLWRYKWHSDYLEVTSFYILSWLILLLFLLAWTKPDYRARGETATRRLAIDCVQGGWPIVLANTGMMLIFFADRMVVSWAATIQNFAEYSLAASAMAVPIMAIQACSKVFFSHLAGVKPDLRKRIYEISSRTLLIVWVLLLPYYFALDFFIRYLLPRYVSSLPYARILLLGIPFLAAIQILQMSYAYLNGLQKHFLGRTTAVLVVSLSVISFTAFHTDSLRIVAGLQVAILGAWWFLNEWTLQKLTGETVSSWVTFLGIYVLTSGSYWLATYWTGLDVAAAVLLYYVLIGVVLAVFCRNHLSLLQEIGSQA